MAIDWDIQKFNNYIAMFDQCPQGCNESAVCPKQTKIMYITKSKSKVCVNTKSFTFCRRHALIKAYSSATWAELEGGRAVLSITEKLSQIVYPVYGTPLSLYAEPSA